MLLDAGSSTLPDAMRAVVEPFLRHEGIGRIDQIFLSHGDYDHISAAGTAVNQYGSPEVLLSPHFRRHAPESPPCLHLLQMLDHSGKSPRLVIAGDQIDAGDGAVRPGALAPRRLQA